jgi:uncharacterized membrane protein YqjE
MADMDETEHREPSIGELVHDIAELASTIIRGEVALAKIELRDTLGRSAAALALFLVAAFLAMAGIVFLLVGMMLLLSPVVGSGPAAVIVTVVLFVAAGITASVGKKKLAPESVPPTAPPRASDAPALPAAPTADRGERS